jgi:methyltransferase (TIGR00027 family)
MQQLVDQVFETAFPLLYAFEPEGMLDSEKNLRVLWVRALLAAAGELDDAVASALLPSASRWIVSPPLARTLWAPALPKLEWITQRTAFIDRAVDSFVGAHADAGGAQIVLVGAGYDTRALRYRSSGCDFFEVDLPDVVAVKAKLRARYLADAEPDGAARAAAAEERCLGVDLNEAAGSVVERLGECGLRTDAPTLVVVEAVLFYLAPPAKERLLAEVARLLRDQPASRLVLTDNLAPLVRGPARGAAEAALAPIGLETLEHSTLWGGAIQFIEAEGAAPPDAAEQRAA